MYEFQSLTSFFKELNNNYCVDFVTINSSYHNIPVKINNRVNFIRSLWMRPAKICKGVDWRPIKKYNIFIGLRIWRPEVRRYGFEQAIGLYRLR
jgi:hypothetical protein